MNCPDFGEWVDAVSGKPSSADLTLLHHIAVKAEVHRPIVQRYRVPISEKRLTPLLVLAAPAPHPDQGRRALAVSGKRIALLDAFGDE